MHNFKRIISILLFVLSFSFAYSKVDPRVDSSDAVVVYDLTEDWLFYNQQYKSFFPYFEENNQSINSISRLVDLNKYQLYNLNFIASPELSLFIDKKLVYTNNSESSSDVRIKIEEIVNNINTEEELITFYHPQGKLPIENFYIGYNSPSNVISNNSPFLLFPRNFQSRQNVFIIAFILILSFFAIVKNRYPKKFYEFTHFGSVIPSIEEDLVRDISSIPVLIFILINSLCMSLILFIVQENFDIPILAFLKGFNSHFETGVLVVSVGFFVILLAKYTYLKLLGWVFNLSEFVKIQFFELMRVSLKINLFITTIAMIVYCSDYFYIKLDFDQLIYFAIGTLIIVIVRVGYLSFKLSGFRNIYLFSYLCTTEILPLAIIIKMILF